MAQLKISILDIGHGDFIYAETPLGNNLIIDCGSGNNIIPSTFLNKLPNISELQISHPHIDHFQDIIAISSKTISSFRCPNLERFSDSVISWKSDDVQKINTLRTLKRKIPPTDSAVMVGNGFSHTVWMPSNIDFNNPNTASCVTTLSFNGFKILFGGDLPESGWDNLLTQQAFINAISGTTVFKVPHHGRVDGCSDNLFKYISPKLCVVSDKSIDDTNENTVATNWYTLRSQGCNISGYTGQRKVMTTRNDGSIHISVDDKGSWTVYPNTTWR